MISIEITNGLDYDGKKKNFKQNNYFFFSFFLKKKEINIRIVGSSLKKKTPLFILNFFFRFVLGNRQKKLHILYTERMIFVFYK